MPLMKGKSQKAFEHNIKTEYKEGKPLKQSLAIAYAMKKKRKKMADGGPVTDPVKTQEAEDSMRKAFHYAKGGEVKGVHESANKAHPGMSDVGIHARMGKSNPVWNEAAKERVKRKTSELKSMPSPKLQGLANGGEVSAMEEDDKDLNQHMPMTKEDMYDDLVDRIMMHKSSDFSDEARYSEGGMVANDVGDGQEADKLENQFDDLVLDDDMEFNYTGANSGDELGNEQEDEDRKDIVSRIMRSSRKKDRNPRPA